MVIGGKEWKDIAYSEEIKILTGGEKAKLDNRISFTSLPAHAIATQLAGEWDEDRVCEKDFFGTHEHRDDTKPTRISQRRK